MPASPWAAIRAAAQSKRRRAHGQAAASEFAIDFLVDGEEGIAERHVGQAGGEARAVAAGGGELLDGVGQGRAEAVEVGDARKFGPRHAVRGLFHQEVEHGGGDLGGARRHSRGRSRRGFGSGCARNTKPSRASRFCRCCAMVAVGTSRRTEERARAERFAKAIQDVGGFAGSGGSREQTHWLQFSAGRRKSEKPASQKVFAGIEKPTPWRSHTCVTRRVSLDAFHTGHWAMVCPTQPAMPVTTVCGLCGTGCASI